MQVIALIGEFASRWLINVFDVTFSVYGEEHFGVSSSLYSYTTAVGSMVNIFQTGWLFNRLLRWDVSIPLITSMTGVCGAIGIFTCLFAPNKAVAILGSVFFIFAYGCAAPTAPTVMSVRSAQRGLTRRPKAPRTCRASARRRCSSAGNPRTSSRPTSSPRSTRWTTDCPSTAVWCPARRCSSAC